MQRERILFPDMDAQLVFQKDEERGLVHVQWYQAEKFLMGFMLRDRRSIVEILKTLTDDIQVFEAMIEKSIDFLEAPESPPKP
jgi:hypothetical protein